jgi:hypothetical protein
MISEQVIPVSYELLFHEPYKMAFPTAGRLHSQEFRSAFGMQLEINRLSSL